MDIFLGRKQTPKFNLGLGEEVVLQLTKDFWTVYFENFLIVQSSLKNYSKKAFLVLEQFEPTEKKCQKWATISRWKWETTSFFFQVIQWLGNGWIIGQCFFYHPPLKEWMTYYQFREEKRVQRPSIQFLVRRLSSLTIVARLELILWNSVLPHIVWIESHLLDFASVFSLMDITCVNSYLIYNMKHPNKLFLLGCKIVVAKNIINTMKAGKGQYQYWDHPESIDNHGGHLPDYQTMQKRCTYCAMEGKENITFVICFACNIPLYIVKERNCFQKHHI